MPAVEPSRNCEDEKDERIPYHGHKEDEPS